MSSRRDFLKRAASIAPSLAALAACSDYPLLEPARSVNVTPLSPSTDCPELSIPRGFRVIKLSETRSRSTANMSLTVPQALDGMACFRVRDQLRLVRNHEITDGVRATAIGSRPYDPDAGGGTSTLVVQVARRGGSLDVRLVDEFVSLSGTLRNCAGGATPWDTWLTCEETVAGAARGFTREHGYVYEVDAQARESSATPLRAMGRFVHEAVSVDPASDIVYLTEDMPYDPANGLAGSGFYRFSPAHRRELQRGRLQMLAITGRAQYVTATGQHRGLELPVHWVDIEDPDPSDAENNRSTVFLQGFARGGAVFQRLEGCWYGDRSVYFNATAGGDAGCGQVWRYIPGSERLVLVFESPGAHVLNKPDNICVSPQGTIVLCEDADDRSVDHYLRVFTRSGQLLDLVRQPASPNTSEFAGACFSPDSDILFFNTQGGTSPTDALRGATYALSGPWKELGL